MSRQGRTPRDLHALHERMAGAGIEGNMGHRRYEPTAVGIGRAHRSSPALLLLVLTVVASLHGSASGQGQGRAVLGPGSCSATACHGGIAPRPAAVSRVLGNEYTTWVSDDPHARAYDVLLLPRSEDIARALSAQALRPVPAHEDPRCLACHSTPRSVAAFQGGAKINTEGVSCESCHGAAGNWLMPHTMLAWRAMPPAQKAEMGFCDTKNLAVQAKVCTGCHIGDRSGKGALAARDVNHDLIAAGHPRLAFEFTAYLANLPPHWDVARAQARPDFPVIAWLVGELVTARATVQLTKDRAGDSEAPWPEFAEYACFSCHHDLVDETWRHEKSLGPTPRGRPEWGVWARPLKESGLDPGLDDLSALMGEIFVDRKRVEQGAGQLLKRWPTPEAPQAVTSAEIEVWWERLDGAKAWGETPHWDAAVRRYLALVDLYQAMKRVAPGRLPADWRPRLESLRCKLSLPVGLDSPRHFDPGNLRP